MGAPGDFPLLRRENLSPIESILQYLFAPPNPLKSPSGSRWRSPPLQFPPFPHKQRVTQDRPGAVKGAKRRSEPLTARTGPHNLALRERGVRGRVAAAEPPPIRALDSLILFPQGQPSYYLS